MQGKYKPLLIIGMIFVIVGILLFILKNHNSHPLNLPQGNTSTNSYMIGDINQDGTVDAVDQNYLNVHIGCKKVDSCWNEVIGKTLSGDNPIYTSDLDLDKSGVIDKEDVNILKSAEKR